MTLPTGIVAGAPGHIAHHDEIHEAINTLRGATGEQFVRMKRSSSHEIFCRFDDKADGALGVTDSAHTFSGHPTSGTGQPRVIGGTLKDTNVGPNGSYSFVQTGGRSLTELGASFSLGAYSTDDSGSAVLIAGSGDFGLAVSLSNPIPDSPCHLVLKRTTWDYGVFVGNVYTVIATGSYRAPLTADGVTFYEASVVIDKVHSTAYVYLPDGQVVRIAHATIGSVVAPWVGIEQFKFTGPSNASQAAFLWFYGSSDKHDNIDRARLDARPLGTAGAYRAPASNADITLGGTAVDVLGASVSFTVPPSKAVWVTLDAFVNVTADGLTLFSIKEGAATLRTITVNTRQPGGKVGARVLVSFPSATVGDTKTYNFFAAQATGTSTLKLDDPNGYQASMTIEPVVL